MHLPMVLKCSFAIASAHALTRNKTSWTLTQVCAGLFCWTGVLGLVGSSKGLISECLVRHRADQIAAANALGLKVASLPAILAGHRPQSSFRNVPCLAYKCLWLCSDTAVGNACDQGKYLKMKCSCRKFVLLVTTQVCLAEDEAMSPRVFENYCCTSLILRCMQRVSLMAFMSLLLSSVHAIVKHLIPHQNLPPCDPTMKASDRALWKGASDRLCFACRASLSQHSSARR